MSFTEQDYAAALAKRIAWHLTSDDEIPVERGDEYSEGYVSQATADGAVVRVPFEVDTVEVGDFVVRVEGESGREAIVTAEQLAEFAGRCHENDHMGVLIDENNDLWRIEIEMQYTSDGGALDTNPVMVCLTTYDHDSGKSFKWHPFNYFTGRTDPEDNAKAYGPWRVLDGPPLS